MRAFIDIAKTKPRREAIRRGKDFEQSVQTTKLRGEKGMNSEHFNERTKLVQ
jgi:hypothetical protein